MSPELQFILAICALVGTYYQRSTRDEVRALREELMDPENGEISRLDERVSNLEALAGIEQAK